MTLAELKKFLEDNSHLPGDTEIVIERSGEDGASPLDDADVKMYDAETTWHGYTYPTDDTIAADNRYTEDDKAPEGSVYAIVLYSVN